MVGLGETRDEILQLMNDLRADYLQNDNLQHRKLKASECVVAIYTMARLARAGAGEDAV